MASLLKLHLPSHHLLIMPSVRAKFVHEKEQLAVILITVLCMTISGAQFTHPTISHEPRLVHFLLMVFELHCLLITWVLDAQYLKWLLRSMIVVGSIYCILLLTVPVYVSTQFASGMWNTSANVCSPPDDSQRSKMNDGIIIGYFTELGLGFALGVLWVKYTLLNRIYKYITSPGFAERRRKARAAVALANAVELSFNPPAAFVMERSTWEMAKKYANMA